MAASLHHPDITLHRNAVQTEDFLEAFILDPEKPCNTVRGPYALVTAPFFNINSAVDLRLKTICSSYGKWTSGQSRVEGRVFRAQKVRG